MMHCGVSVTLNADDPLLLTTTLTDEYLQVSRTFELSDRQLADLAAAALTTAGMTETTRTRLLAGIRRWPDDNHPKRGHHG